MCLRIQSMAGDVKCELSQPPTVSLSAVAEVVAKDFAAPARCIQFLAADRHLDLNKTLEELELEDGVVLTCVCTESPPCADDFRVVPEEMQNEIQLEHLPTGSCLNVKVHESGYYCHRNLLNASVVVTGGVPVLKFDYWFCACSDAQGGFSVNVRMGVEQPLGLKDGQLTTKGPRSESIRCASNRAWLCDT